MLLFLMALYLNNHSNNSNEILTVILWCYFFPHQTFDSFDSRPPFWLCPFFSLSYLCSVCWRVDFFIPPPHTNPHTYPRYQGDGVADDIMPRLSCIAGRSLAGFMGWWRGLAQHNLLCSFHLCLFLPLFCCFCCLCGLSASGCPACSVFPGKKINYSTHSLN